LFTVEFDDDETLITVLDGTSELEDVSVLLYDDYCHVRQWNEQLQRFNVITMTSEMYLQLMQAWKKPEGAYILRRTGMGPG